MKIYCLYDSKVKSYGTPFFGESNAEVLRDFETLANDRKTKVGLYPADFVLFELGEFDKFSCSFNLHTAPYNLASALQYVNSPLPVGNVDESKVAVVS